MTPSKLSDIFVSQLPDRGSIITRVPTSQGCQHREYLGAFKSSINVSSDNYSKGADSEDLELPAQNYVSGIVNSKDTRDVQSN